ncbi:hypothetical protein Tco_0158023 [Tanacetum coccineum]
MARYGSMHHHLCQQVLDMSKDEGRLPEAIRFTSTTRNTPLEMGKYSHGFYHKTTKDNKQLRHDLEVFRRRTTSYSVGRDPDDKLHFIEEPVEIMDREVKWLNQSRIPIVKDSFFSCLSHLDKMLKRCEDTNLVLNLEKCHFMVKKGIVLGHKISKSRIEVDRAKVDVIAKLPNLTSVKGI